MYWRWSKIIYCLTLLQGGIRARCKPYADAAHPPWADTSTAVTIRPATSYILVATAVETVIAQSGSGISARRGDMPGKANFSMCLVFVSCLPCHRSFTLLL